MKSSIKQILGVAVAGLLTGSVSFAAAPFAPVGTHNQTLPVQSFGGTGGNIPVNHVTTATYQNPAGGSMLTLGLGAHERNVLPGVLGYDNAGTFTANTGTSASYGGTDAPIPNGTWNINYFLDNKGGLNLYSYKLTIASAAQTITYTDLLNPALGNFPLLSTTTAGNSENPGFDFLGFTSYDPTANADYAVSLEAFNVSDVNQSQALAKSAINIRVGTGSASVPDSGSTLALMGVAFAGIAGLRRKFLA